MAKSRQIAHAFECGVKINATPMVCYSAGLRAQPPQLVNFGEDEGMTGNINPQKGRRRVSRIDVGGPLLFKPTAAEAVILLQEIFSGSSGAGEGDWTGYTYYDFTKALHVDFSEASPTGTHTILIDRYAEGYTYTKALCNALTIRWSESDPVEFELDYLGCTETAGAVDAGSPTLASPLLGSDVTVYLGGTEYFPISGELTLSRNYKSRFISSLYRSAASPGKTSVTGSLVFDWNTDSADDLFVKNLTNNALAFRLVIDDGTDKIGIGIPELVFPGGTPEVSGEGEITPALEFQGSDDGSNAIITGYADIA